MSPPRTAPTTNELLARDRKAEHIELALERRMQLDERWFDRFFLEHQALPEIDFDEIDTSTSFLDKRLDAPLLISCMTGGTPEAARINRHLAQAAERARIAIGVGSQRKAIEEPGLADTFEVRPHAPSVPVLANLGAVQLNYGFGIDECRRAVEMVDADALVLHLNTLQEVIQPEGQRNFSKLLPKIGRIASELQVPVIVKEIGCGISAGVARRLLERGVRIIDSAGTGGTTWARIEAARAGNSELGEIFAGWGIPTPLAIRQLRQVEGLSIIGSGGVRNGLDAAKAIALGADLVGMACPFLDAARQSAARVGDKIDRTVYELKTAMFCSGAPTIGALGRARISRTMEEPWTGR